MRTVAATQTEVTEQSLVGAAAVVPILKRAEIVRASFEERALQLRLCATREAEERERRELHTLREEHVQLTRRAAWVLSEARDSPLLRDAAAQRLRHELRPLDTEAALAEESQMQEPSDVANLSRLMAEERLREVTRIESDVAALREIAGDLAVMTAVQGAHLSVASDYVETVVKDSTDAAEELGKAERARNAVRKRKFWLVVGVVAVILTAGVALVVWKLV